MKRCSTEFLIYDRVYRLVAQTTGCSVLLQVRPLGTHIDRATWMGLVKVRECLQSEIRAAIHEKDSRLSDSELQVLAEECQRLL